MYQVIIQCIKELLQFWRYRLTVALAFLLPFITLLIYGFAIRLETKNIPLVVQDFDKTPLSRAYIDSFVTSNQYNLIIRKLKNGNETDIQTALNNGTAKAGMIIPPDFTRKIKRGQSVNVQFLVDGSDVVNSNVIRNGVVAITQAFMTSNGLKEQQIRINQKLRIWFNPGRREALFIVPGVFTVALGIFPTILCSIAMVREKEEGNIIQVYASGITAFQLIAGKSLAYLIIAIGETIVTMGAGVIIFGLRLVGSPTAFILSTLFFLASSVLMGTMIGSYVNDQRSAIQFAGTIQALAAMLFSGFIYPISNIPVPINYIAYVVPASYYMILVRDAFVRGAGLRSTWILILVLAIISGLELLAALRRMRKMQLD